MRCWWICFLLVSTADAQVIYDTYALSIASADVCLGRGVYMGRNPASIAEQKRTMCGISQVIPFGIAGLSTNTFYLSGKYKKQSYSFEYAQQGIEAYREHINSLTAGMQLSQNLSFGVKLLSMVLAVPEESTRIRYRVELGIVERINTKLSAGIHFKLRTSKEIEVFQNTTLSMGFCYYLDPKLPLHVSVEMAEMGPAKIRAGMEYALAKTMAVRLGWNNRDAAFSSGINYRIKKYSVEMSTSYHSRLGISYGVGLGFLFNEKKN